MISVDRSHYLKGIDMDFPAASLIDYVSGILALLAAISSVAAWMQSIANRNALSSEKERQNAAIGIKLVCEDGRFRLLDLEMIRAEVSRAEVLGRLGMLPMASKGQRFSIAWLSSREFLQELARIRDGVGNDVIRVKVSASEFDQFV